MTSSLRRAIVALLVVPIFLACGRVGAAGNDSGAGALPANDVALSELSCSSSGGVSCKADDTLTLQLGSLKGGKLDDIWKGADIKLRLPGAPDSECIAVLTPKVIPMTAMDTSAKASFWLSPIFDPGYGKGGQCSLGSLFTQPLATVDVVLQITLGSGLQLSKQLSIDVGALYRDGRRTIVFGAPTCENQGDCRVGDELRIPAPSLSQGLDALGIKAQDLSLALDGVAMDGKPEAGFDGHSWFVAFKLLRDIPANPEASNNANSVAWLSLFSRWTGDRSPNSINVSLRHDSRAWPVNGGIYIHSGRGACVPYLIALIAVASLLLPMACQQGFRSTSALPKTWDLLQEAKYANAVLASYDRVPPSGDAATNSARKLIRPPLSLSRILTLWWLAIASMSLAYALFMTHTIDVINDTVLSLLGLSVAVTAGATLADRPNGKDGKADDQLCAALTATPLSPAAIQAAISSAKEQMLISGSVVTDLLAESDAKIIDPHRLQMLFFSIVFGFFYVGKLNQIVALPYFSSSVLGLLGISSATYLGFKLVKQAD